MLGFPTPYPEELIYSTIARAGVHEGGTSPKQLLDLVFKNRKVIATVDLPSHVESIATHYPKSLKLDARVLIHRHTLWQIYAPFQPYKRNEKLLDWMRGPSQGAAHLASGIAASRVKAKTRLYTCPKCLEEQKAEYGECFWNRLWQVPLVNCCPTHGPLYATNIELNGEHRHSYFPVEAAEPLNPEQVAPVDNVFAQQVVMLIRNKPTKLNFAKWTNFYRELAMNLGLMSGMRIDHSAIHASVIQFWGLRWLANVGILPSGTETSWLRAIFRKHRKSFNFAEHIVAVQGVSGGLISISDAIESAAKMVISEETVVSADFSADANPTELSEDQLHWISLLQWRSPKQARKLNPALYARLYRNHHEWLIQTDEKFHIAEQTINRRVDWPKRDRQIARKLRHVCLQFSENLNAPHLSKTFLIHQLENRAMIEKNLYRLPRCSVLLEFYVESITEYQARRLTRAYISFVRNRQEIKRWSLLREAGLSDERMTTVVSRFLRQILSEQASSKI